MSNFFNNLGNVQNHVNNTRTSSSVDYSKLVGANTSMPMSNANTTTKVNVLYDAGLNELVPYTVYVSKTLTKYHEIKIKGFIEGQDNLRIEYVWEPLKHDSPIDTKYNKSTPKYKFDAMNDPMGAELALYQCQLFLTTIVTSALKELGYNSVIEYVAPNCLDNMANHTPNANPVVNTKPSTPNTQHTPFNPVKPNTTPVQQPINNDNPLADDDFNSIMASFNTPKSAPTPKATQEPVKPIINPCTPVESKDSDVSDMANRVATLERENAELKALVEKLISQNEELMQTVKSMVSATPKQQPVTHQSPAFNPMNMNNQQPINTDDTSPFKKSTRQRDMGNYEW